MIFDVQFQNQKVIDGYSIAGSILGNLDFHDRIYSQEEFTYTKQSPALVALALQRAIEKIRKGFGPMVIVDSYFYRNANVIAKTLPGDGINKIFINKNSVPFATVETYIKNGVHEFGHEPMGFSHGTNYPPGSRIGWLMGDRADKNKSVNHTLERLAIEFAKERKLV